MFSWFFTDAEQKIKDEKNAKWQKITSIVEFPNADELFKYGTYATYFHFQKLLYNAQIDFLKKVL